MTPNIWASPPEGTLSIALILCPLINIMWPTVQFYRTLFERQTKIRLTTCWPCSIYSYWTYGVKQRRCFSVFLPRSALHGGFRLFCIIEIEVTFNSVSIVFISDISIYMLNILSYYSPPQKFLKKMFQLMVIFIPTYLGGKSNRADRCRNCSIFSTWF